MDQSSGERMRNLQVAGGATHKNGPLYGAIGAGAARLRTESSLEGYRSSGSTAEDTSRVPPLGAVWPGGGGGGARPREFHPITLINLKRGMSNLVSESLEHLVQESSVGS